MCNIIFECKYKFCQSLYIYTFQENVDTLGVEIDRLNKQLKS